MYWPNSVGWGVPFCVENTHFSLTKSVPIEDCFDRVLGKCFWYSTKYLLSNAHHLANDYKWTRSSNRYFWLDGEKWRRISYFAIPLAHSELVLPSAQNQLTKAEWAWEVISEGASELKKNLDHFSPSFLGQKWYFWIQIPFWG